MFGFLNRIFNMVTHIAPAKMGKLFNNAISPTAQAAVSISQAGYGAIGKAIEESESLCKW